ncbi:amidohydrolase family protein [Robertkochia aurantiaca]|uniref:amidohydrolase family protein n=1 Tax=Robertkochia aurantiaca TaxID=2873700 RepID=UPI001CCBE6B6|nr:amidohydrolase family protein [Robertkochia sp. 3YJGBD-33]
MKSIRSIITSLTLLLALTLSAQQTPAPAQQEAVLITGVTTHIGNGEVIENSAVGFAEGKINFVGPASEAESGSYGKVIEGNGRHLYPGFIAVNSTLGLVEIDAVRATDDIEEVGGIIPHVRSLIAYNAESKVVESMRPNGVLMAQIAPRGGRVPGTSSVVQLDAWNWEDAALKVDDAIHMDWPSRYTRGRWWLGEDPGLKPNDKYREQVDEVFTFMKEAKAYLAGPQQEINLPYQAVKGLFDGSQKLYINVDDSKSILEAIERTEAAGIGKIVIIGGDNAHLVAETLAEKNIPVVVKRPHRIPENSYQNVKHPFKLASMLADKGVMVTVDVSGQMERMNTRNLPFYAGTVAAYGMDKEDAVKMITGDAAKILGIEEFAGTIAVGKDATLFLSEGDALDMRTNKVSEAFIQGRDISLETHQTELYKRYSNKYDNQE